MLDLDRHLPGTAWGEAKAVGTSLIGPAGTSAASSAASHSADACSAKRSRSVAISSTRFSTRSPFVANRGSSASAGSPSARQKRGHWRSLPTATAISPSAVSNVSYGTMFGWALPSRPGCDAVDERVLGLVDEHRQRRFEDRHVDALAGPVGGRRRKLPAGERGEDPDRGVEPRRDVGDRDADLRRAAAVGVGRAGDRHQPGLGLEEEVVAGAADERPGRAVAADREVDQAPG